MWWKQRVHIRRNAGLGWKDEAGVLWVELCPPKLYAEVPTPSTSEVTLFRNRVVADIIKMRSYWSRVGPYI